MGIIKRAKKLAFDISKKNKAFRIVMRTSRDAVYHAKMVLDAPAAPVDEQKNIFQDILRERIQ